jgi:hypothetical protein
MNQLDLFNTDEFVVKKKRKFQFKRRGCIYTEKIWKELNVHQKINLRSHHGGAIMPNYLLISRAIDENLDQYPELKYNVYTLFYMIVSPRKLKNK